MYGFEKDSPGSGIIEAMLFVLVVAFFGFAGWITYKSSNIHKTPTTTIQKTEATASTTSKSSTNTYNNPTKTSSPTSVSTTTPTTTPSTTSTSPPSGEYVIDIQGMAIEITVPTGIKDLTYNVTTNSGGVNVATFSTQSLSAEVPQCSADVGSGAFDTVLRGNGKYPGASNPSDGALIVQKQNPTYYIAYELPTGPCAKNLTPTEQSLLDNQQEDFYSSLTTVQAS